MQTPGSVGPQHNTEQHSPQEGSPASRGLQVLTSLTDKKHWGGEREGEASVFNRQTSNMWSLSLMTTMNMGKKK